MQVTQDAASRNERSRLVVEAEKARQAFEEEIGTRSPRPRIEMSFIHSNGECGRAIDRPARHPARPAVEGAGAERPPGEPQVERCRSREQPMLHRRHATDTRGFAGRLGATIIARMLDPAPRTSRFAAVALTTLLLFLVTAPASAQPVACGEYRGVTCQGYFTDETGVVLNRQRVEDAIARMVEAHGNPIAVVIVNDSRGESPVDFAVALADDWGVGDPNEENGILILVSLEERRTEVVTQGGLSIPGTTVSRTANGYFREGDFEGGVLAMLGVVDQMLAGDFESPPPRSLSPFGVGGLVLLAVLIVGAVVAGKGISGRRSRAGAERRRRSRVVDGDLGVLAPAGHELPRFVDFEVPTPEPDSPGPTRLALEGLRRIGDGGPILDEQVVRLLATSRLVVVVDRDRLEAETREPLELRVSQERPVGGGPVGDGRPARVY